MKIKPESIVIVKNDHGYVASVLYSDKTKSRLISANDKPAIYNLIEKYVRSLNNG